MKVQIYGKNITVTPAIAEKIEKKLNMLNKYFIIEEDDTANVVVRVYPTKQKIEVTIPTKYAVLRAEVVHDDLYAAIDLAVDGVLGRGRRAGAQPAGCQNQEKWGDFHDRSFFLWGEAGVDSVNDFL